MADNFALGMFGAFGSPPFAALVVDDRAIAIEPLHVAFKASHGGASVISGPCSVRGLLEDWTRNFAGLQDLVRYAKAEGLFEAGGLAAPVEGLHPAALLRPGKLLCAAANYRAHVKEMRDSGFTGGNTVAESAPLRPYHFLKAPSCSVGANDPIRLPSNDAHIDWEIELAAVIGAPAKRVAAGDALKHVAGYAVCNDISCRAATWRADRPNVRSDWLAGKSYDTFFPFGPLLVPSAFVPDYRKLRLQLSVNGAVKQDGLASDMIFNLEEQIEYLSAMLTLEPGDVIATGTPAGVGQGQNQYLSPGDVVESTIAGLGSQRNVVEAASA